MNLWFLSLFVKDYREQNSAAVRSRCAAVASIVGIASNVLLSALKLVIGIITHSIAITADAVNNISDAASSVITLVGFRLASKPADSKHPYGHQRIEYITGLIVSMFITVLGVQFFTDSIDAIRNPTTTEYTTASFIILAVSIIIKFWQSTFYKALGKHISSSALIAASADSRNDTLSTFAVLIGAIISRFAGYNLDGWLGLAVACFIIKSGISLIIEASDPLLGAAPSDELVASIAGRIMSYEGVLGLHDLVVHNYGPQRCFASVHVEVPAEQDILTSHDIIDNIEFDFRREMGIDLVGHLDPIITSDEELSELRREIEALVAVLSVECGCAISMHDFRIVRAKSHTNLLFDIVVPFECKLKDSELCASLDKKIKALDPSYNSVITCDRSYLSTTIDNKSK